MAIATTGPANGTQARRRQKRGIMVADTSAVPLPTVNDIAQRKADHIDIVLSGGVAARDVSTGFERVRFEHCALPELDLDSIDLSVSLVGRRMQAPLIVSSMTGGPLHARRINHSIAEAAGRLGIGFAVGSQRIALEGKASAGFSRELRALAGPVPILANFGAAQLKTWDGPAMAMRAIEMIDADAMIVHLNPLQEAVQAGGDRDWSGLLRRIEMLARTCQRPIVVKEVGAGISGAVAHRLWNAGVTIIDVAGAGGTSWAAVEGRRASDPASRAIAEAFRDWGTPTAAAIADVRRACPGATVIASGGIQDGVDAAKAIRLGADIVGQAAGVLPAALQSADAVAAHLEVMIATLRIACFCTGCADLSALRHAPLVDVGA
jgi:isopentenyl-diphosphate delta-isomerase